MTNTQTQTSIQDMPELQELLKLPEKERKAAAEILLDVEGEKLREEFEAWERATDEVWSKLDE